MPEISFATTASKNGAGLLEPLAQVYLLLGGDDALKREATERLLDAGLDPSFADFDRETIDLGAGGNAAENGEDPTVQILSAAASAPFGSPRKVVIVRSIQRLAKDRQEALAAGVSKLGALTLLILVADAPEYEAGRPKGRQVEAVLKKAVSNAGMVVICDALQSGDLRSRARILIEESGKTADEAAISALVARASSASAAPGAGGDLNTLAQETQKLITYAGERSHITAADAALLITQSPDENIFPLLDAVGARNTKRAAELVDALLDTGDKPDAVAARTLVMLQRHFRLLSLAKYLAERRIPPKGALPEEIKELLSGELVGVAASQAYRLPAYARQAAGFTWSELNLAMERILASDLAMKGIALADSLGQESPAGSDEPAANLRLLIFSLCRMKQASA
jgi:DNA polymerase-3 subunit delta